MKKTETLGKEFYESTDKVIKIKRQETLEEAKERYLDSPLPHSYKLAVEFGAKWQQERSYSEEEVLEFTQTMIMQYKFGNTNIEQMDFLKESLQQFKNK